MKKILFSLFIVFLCGINLFAQNIKFKVKAPEVVAVGEQFSLKYSVNARGSNLQVPDFKNLRLLVGPSVSQSMYTTNINGQSKMEVDFSYTYMVLAEKEGTAIIPAATITINGKKYKSNSLKIQVVKVGSAKKQKSNTNNGNSIKRSTNSNKSDVFIDLVFDKKSVYINQYLTATIKLYTRKDISKYNMKKNPEFDGFVSQNIELSKGYNRSREVVNNELYNVFELAKFLLLPQKTGKIKIAPIEIDCYTQKRVGNDPFGGFFAQYKNITIPCKSKTKYINVKELPAKPLGFDGAVGNFKLSSSITKPKKGQKLYRQNDAITIKVNIVGSGNLKLINGVELDIPSDFDKYDPKTNNNIRVTSKGLVGSASFEYLVIPRHPGEFVIPSAEFVYFNPSTRRYKTLKTKEFKITVEKGEGVVNTPTNAISSFNQEDIKFIGKDIRYIKVNGVKLIKKGNFLFGTNKFYLFYIIPLLLFVLIFFIRRKRIKDNSDIVRVKNKKANKVAIKRLKVSQAFLKQNKNDEFYDELLRALWGYTGDKLNIPVAKLSRENISDIFHSYNIESEVVIDFINILDDCEFARYSPMGGTEQMDKLYNSALGTISKIEKSIR